MCVCVKRKTFNQENGSYSINHASRTLGGACFKSLLLILYGMSVKGNTDFFVTTN